jgi:hypothetical protein
MTSNPSFDDAATAAIPGVPHRWTALTIALTVIGFIVFWPLGLAMIAYVLWGQKIAAATRGSTGAAGATDWFKKAADDFGRNIREEFSPKGFSGVRRTGNPAFDAWRASELARIEEERRKLDETTAAFEAHLRAERGAYDEGRAREEFDRFMSERRAG